MASVSIEKQRAGSNQIRKTIDNQMTQSDGRKNRNREKS